MKQDKGTFERIRIQGFRRLRNNDIPMRSLTVLIGANGAGKTSFLDAWSLVAAAAGGRLADNIKDLGGIGDLLTRDKSDSLVLELDMGVSFHPSLEYHMRLAPTGQSYEIVEERLVQHRKGKDMSPLLHIDSKRHDIKYYDVESEPDKRKLVRPNWEHRSLETSLSQVPKMFREPEAFRERLATSTHYGPLNVAPLAPVRLPQKMQPSTLPGVHGEELVSSLYNLRETDRDQFEVIKDGLIAAFPDFERLDFPPVAAGTLAMTWKDKHYSKPMYMHQLSEGMLRFLWLTTLLRSRNLTAITLLDEPEVSLHPELLSMLADLMRDAAQRTQLIVATHSDRLIRFLHPKEVLVCDVHEGEARMTWADSLDLEKWLDEYSLDEVWRMGRMGGRA